MRIFLFICAALTLLWSLMMYAGATTAFHEIQASIIFMTSALLFTGAAIIEAVTSLQKNINSKG